MSFNPVYSLGAVACLCVALSACGSSQSAPPASTHTQARVVATSVPVQLVGYASLAVPTLKQTVVAGNTLLKAVRSAHRSDLENLGSQCALVGGSLADYNTSFRSTWVPNGAKSAYHDGTQAFKVLLSSTDECAMAADARDSKQLKLAESDMSYALWVLDRVEHSISPWNQSHA